MLGGGKGGLVSPGIPLLGSSSSSGEAGSQQYSHFPLPGMSIQSQGYSAAGAAASGIHGPPPPPPVAGQPPPIMARHNSE